jgi:hypothetical protein
MFVFCQISKIHLRKKREEVITVLEFPHAILYVFSKSKRERNKRESERQKRERVEGRERGEIQFLKRNFIAHF